MNTSAIDISETEQCIIDSYVKRQAEVRKAMIFNDLSATCIRALPPLGALTPGMRLAVVESGAPVRILVEVVQQKGEFYFQILSSRHPDIVCQPCMPVQVLASCVYSGRKPPGTPKLPQTKEGWKKLEGKGGHTLRFWQVLCQFKDVPLRQKSRSRTRA